MAWFTSENAAEYGRRGGRRSRLCKAKGTRQKAKPSALSDVYLVPFAVYLHSGGR